MRLAARRRIVTTAVAAAALALAGCVTQTGQGQGTYPTPYPAPPGPTQPAPPPVLQPPAPVIVAPPPKPAPNYPKTAEEFSGQTVVSLMKQARAAQAAGNFDQAIAKLENARRIEPRNYFVWSALGRVYLDKKLFADAEGMALKSNSLARGNHYVELENWKTIGAAREALGDSIGYLEAQNKVDQIQRNLTGG